MGEGWPDLGHRKQLHADIILLSKQTVLAAPKNMIQHKMSKLCYVSVVTVHNAERFTRLKLNSKGVGLNIKKPVC